MKKQVFFIIAAVMLIALPTQAGLKWGLKAGMNLSSISTDAEDNLKNYTGFQVGPIAEFTVPLIGLGFDAAVLYSQRGFKSGDTSHKLGYLDIPVNLKYKVGLLNLVGAYATAGPYLSYKLSESDAFKNKDWKDSQFGLNFGLGVEVLSKLQVGANYQLGLTDDYKVGNDSYKNSTWTISAAYFF